MDKIMNDDIDLLDYPYIGLGQRPTGNNKNISEDKLEKLSY